MEYIILWIFALFGLWSLISNILESICITNKEGCVDVTLNVCNQEENIELLIRQLSRIDMIGKIRIIDNNSTDDTMKIVEAISKSNFKVELNEGTYKILEK